MTTTPSLQVDVSTPRRRMTPPTPQGKKKTIIWGTLLAEADATRKEKAIIWGKVLAEAQQRHPTDKAFAKFLKLAGGVGIRRARNLIAIATGRKDFEQAQDEHAAAQARYQDKKDKSAASESQSDAATDVEPTAESDAWRNQTAQLAIEVKSELEVELVPTHYTALPEINVAALRGVEPILMTPRLQAALINLREADANVKANPPVKNRKRCSQATALRSCFL